MNMEQEQNIQRVTSDNQVNTINSRQGVTFMEGKPAGPIAMFREMPVEQDRFWHAHTPYSSVFYDPFEWVYQDISVSTFLAVDYTLDVNNWDAKFTDDLKLAKGGSSEPVARGGRRSLVLAPSGSGKSYFIENSGRNDLVDLDTIIPWPQTKFWWRDPNLNALQQKVIGESIGSWLTEQDDGLIGFYADTADGTLVPDAVVLLPEKKHKELLATRPVDSPQPRDFAEVKQSRDKLWKLSSYGVPTFGSVGEAVAHFDAVSKPNGKGLGNPGNKAALIVNEDS